MIILQSAVANVTVLILCGFYFIKQFIYKPYLTVEDKIEKTINYWHENSQEIEDDEFRKDLKKRKGVVFSLVSFYFWGEYFINIIAYQIAILYAALKLTNLY